MYGYIEILNRLINTDFTSGDLEHSYEKLKYLSTKNNIYHSKKADVRIYFTRTDLSHVYILAILHQDDHPCEKRSKWFKLLEKRANKV